ncbi:zinc finger BED domain-containing protein RICESLEEPER 2 [Tanacetum coccineum]
MDKSWIKAQITSKPFKEGVKDFIEFARARSIRGIIACPCLKCCNVEHWEVDKCYGHILRYGFLSGYTNWSIHGENSVPSQPSRPTFGEDEIRSLVRNALGWNVGESSKSSQPSRPTFGEDEIRNLVRDALGQIPSDSRGVGDSMFEDNVGESSQSSHRRVEDENVGESSKTSDDSATYKKLLEECDKELYPGYNSASLSFSANTTMDPQMGLFYSLRQESAKWARSDQSSTNEIGRYIRIDWINTMGPEEFTKFDILAWWKGRESQFSVLAVMARDLLSVQPSTVASESSFSTSGRVLSRRRTRFTPTSLEMCICLKDHLDAVERMQHISSHKDVLEYEEQLHETEVATGDAFSLSDEEIALDEVASEARSSEAEEEDLTLEQALN